MKKKTTAALMWIIIVSTVLVHAEAAVFISTWRDIYNGAVTPGAYTATGTTPRSPVAAPALIAPVLRMARTNSSTIPRVRRPGQTRSRSLM